MPEEKARMVILLGPTGVGKSAASLALAERFDAEIISADSMQVYRHLDIGTAKPGPEERRRVRHHLIDLVEPDEEFNAAIYRDEARKVVADLKMRNKRGLVVGGAGFYIRAFLKGLFPCPPKDEGLRQKLMDEAERLGRAHLHNRLRKVDPESAARLAERDLVRIMRALEVYELTGRPLSAHIKAHGFSEEPFDTLKVGLYRERDELYERIEKRVDGMLSAGLVEEVRGLLSEGYSPDIKPFRSLTYKHVIACLQKRTDPDEAVKRIKRDTRRYAKRQMTWFRAEGGILWLNASNPGWEERLEREVTRFWR